MPGTVYVTHCIDTEGPLFESLEATFERLESIFGIELSPSEETLKRLQNGEMDLGGVEDEVQKIVAPKQIETNETWGEIRRQLDEITSPEFRRQYPDSADRNWRYSWFILDHAGFSGENPRRRGLGHHVVYDQYRSHMRQNDVNVDDVYWHYHPLSIRRDAHRCGTTYLDSDNVYNVLARKIVDRSWFPSAYRPGFHTERPDSHWFLEQWIPFDFGNQSGEVPEGQPDLARGRFGNWRRAPTDWTPYNPAYDDYQSRGNCDRYIARCLNMDTRHRNITEDEIRRAFREADETGSALLAFTDHDFRDMSAHIDKVWRMISDVSKEFDEVEFEHATAVEGMREVLDIGPVRPPELNLECVEHDGTPVVCVTAENEIFGRQPFLALKTKTGEYHWENFDFPEEATWTYTFDFHTLPLDSIETVGVAANSPTGVTEVCKYDPETGEVERNTWHASRDAEL